MKFLSPRAALAAIVVLCLLPLLAFAQTVTLTSNVASGTGSVTPTLTWSSTGAASCTASGGWSGTKATSGTETVSAITRDTTFTLTCAAATGRVTLSWTAPTTRSDGSALTNLATYRAYWSESNSPAPSVSAATITAPATSHVLGGVTPGVRYFWLSAVDAAGVESAKAGPATATIIASSAAASATVKVQSVPNPPTGFTVTPVVADLNMSPVFRINADGSRGTAVLGFVPVGTRTASGPVYTYRGRGYCPVDPTTVKWWGTSPTTSAAVACS